MTRLSILTVLGLITLCGCGAGEEGRKRPTVHVPKPRAETHAEHDERVNAAVQVRGIEGTLSNFDVRTAMEEQGKEFAACHEPRARELPMLSGQIEFAIQVDVDGQTKRVEVRASDLGDRDLERCLSDVIRATKFRKPNGGIANVTWLMVLEPARAGNPPEAWEAGRVARVIGKKLDDLKTRCELSASSSSLTVTAYVNSGGKILAAGVASPSGSPDQHLDCVAEDLMSWPMPKPQKRYAKVSFVLSP